MSNAPVLRPARGSDKKLNGEVAVGEDLAFQRKWWKFERAVWIVFTLIVAADLAGAFGQGPLAKSNARAADGSIDLRYERMERVSTPSILTVEFGPSAIRNGKVSLYVSDSLVKNLGARRVVPAPQSSMIGNGGLSYTLPASALPASMEFELEPTRPGLSHVTIQVAGAQPVTVSIFVFP
jgi:hypothetical protein